MSRQLAARSHSRMEKVLSNYDTGEDAGAIVVALAALNDATLALVEQQRIANLIALSHRGIDQLSEAGREGLIAPNGLIHPVIAAALGIKTETDND